MSARNTEKQKKVDIVEVEHDAKAPEPETVYHAKNEGVNIRKAKIRKLAGEIESPAADPFKQTEIKGGAKIIEESKRIKRLKTDIVEYHKKACARPVMTAEEAAAEEGLYKNIAQDMNVRTPFWDLPGNLTPNARAAWSEDIIKQTDAVHLKMVFEFAQKKVEEEH
jgi:hypothetical protein